MEPSQDKNSLDFTDAKTVWRTILLILVIGMGMVLEISRPEFGRSENVNATIILFVELEPLPLACLFMLSLAAYFYWEKLGTGRWIACGNQLERLLQKPWLVGALSTLALVISAAGWFIVYHAYCLSMDEFILHWQAILYQHGDLRAFVSQKWVYDHFYYAMSPAFAVVHSGSPHPWWVSLYLPAYAMTLAFAEMIHVAWLLNPLLGAFSVLFLAGCAREIFPESRVAPGLSALLLVTSSQFLLTSMSAYTWSAHLCLNLLWLCLHLKKDWRWWVWAPIVGVVALGLHQPFPHALFVLPFLISITLRRQWRRVFWYATIYLAGCILWFEYWMWARQLIKDMAIFSYNPLMWIYQLIGFVETISWNNLTLAFLVLTAIRFTLYWPRIIWELATGMVLPFIFYIITIQGHGWGYRFFYPHLGSAILVGVYGFELLAKSEHRQKTLTCVWAGVVTAVFLFIPVRCLQAEHFIRPFAQAFDVLSHEKADFVVMEVSRGWYALDFMRNSPYLDNKPLFFVKELIQPKDLPELEKRGTVKFIQDHDWEKLGLVYLNGEPFLKPPAK